MDKKDNRILCYSCYWMKPVAVGRDCSLKNRPIPRYRTCKDYELDEDKELEEEVFWEKERAKNSRR